MAGRQDSQPVFSRAKLLILLAQKTRFTPQMYSELAQFFNREKACQARLLTGVVGPGEQGEIFRDY
jgi:hypothetical protein